MGEDRETCHVTGPSTTQHQREKKEYSPNLHHLRLRLLQHIRAVPGIAHQVREMILQRLLMGRLVNVFQDLEDGACIAVVFEEDFLVVGHFADGAAMVISKGFWGEWEGEGAHLTSP